MSEHHEPYEIESIGQILDRLATPEGQRAVRDEERAFRRGFHHGYEAAIDDIEAMIKSGVEPKLMLRRMVTHAEGAVMDWRRSVGDVAVDPPRLS